MGVPIIAVRIKHRRDISADTSLRSSIVEQRFHKPKVAGASPAGGTNFCAASIGPAGYRKGKDCVLRRSNSNLH